MHKLTLNDLKLYYQDQGTGYPVVLLHGLGSDNTVWEGVTPLLKEEYRVLAVDLRGHGSSSKPPGPYSMELFSQDIIRFLNSLDNRSGTLYRPFYGWCYITRTGSATRT